MTGSIDHWDPQPTDVVLQVPAAAASLRVVRMVASTVVADAGFDVDEVDDVRMAVDELCAAVIESGAASPLRVQLRVEGDRLSVRADAAQLDGARAAPVDELRAAVLGATAGEYRFALLDGVSVAWLTKRSAVSAAGHGYSGA